MGKDAKKRCLTYEDHASKGTMSLEEKLLASFCCVKCRGKTAVTRTVKLSGKFPPLLAFPSEEYVLVTCTLCGYTEMYSPVAYAGRTEPAPESKPLAHET